MTFYWPLSDINVVGNINIFILIVREQELYTLTAVLTTTLVANVRPRCPRCSKVVYPLFVACDIYSSISCNYKCNISRDILITNNSLKDNSFLIYYEIRPTLANHVHQ